MPPNESHLSQSDARSSNREIAEYLVGFIEAAREQRWGREANREKVAETVEALVRVAAAVDPRLPLDALERLLGRDAGRWLAEELHLLADELVGDRRYGIQGGTDEQAHRGSGSDRSVPGPARPETITDYDAGL